MQDIKREVEMLETVELQLLGGLHKINRGNKDAGQADMEKVAKQCKARCKSIKCKLEMLEKELKAEKEKNP